MNNNKRKRLNKAASKGGKSVLPGRFHPSKPNPSHAASPVSIHKRRHFVDVEDILSFRLPKAKNRKEGTTNREKKKKPTKPKFKFSKAG